ncbi:MAG: histone H1 [Candidatus Neomarinimicrobiota bacterium]|nr:histone H1 [Candidatus Neomarinimicrobiota bacterium]|tara:strand:+ start:152 stop:334 length:183 start_codon:yes stop_codon:yes gene_type:complete
MSTSQELFNNMKTMWDALEENHTAFAANGNKAAGTRARKAAGEFKKMVTDYRKASVAESK